MVVNILEKIFETLKASNDRGYIGEEVSQLEHALQCAHFAAKMKDDPEVILAALFHDIGHLMAPKDAPQMDQLGVLDHETIGAAILKEAGFTDKICQLVSNHVNGKRYLCFKNPSYYERLSEASKGTLRFQGGPMEEVEAFQFEKSVYFDDHLIIRKSDELAKVKDLKVLPIKHYQQLSSQLL